MGTYVYALNTKIRTVSGETIGIAEYRFKCGRLSEDAEMFDRYCKRRVDFFKNNPNMVPTLMTFSAETPNKFEDGAAVFLLVNTSFHDGGDYTKVGNMKKTGKGWTIIYTNGAAEIIAKYKEDQKRIAEEWKDYE